jgi:molybdopterin-containing oxidoreductase family membrane subunit
MTSSLNDPVQSRDILETVSSDLLKHVRISRGFMIWMGMLAGGLGTCLYFYYVQLREGLGVTGMRDFTSWGMYIANFVFFVATSLVGMLISSVLGLAGAKWAKPIARIAEIIAVAFAAVAGLVIISDMGRPERLHYVFIHARLQSPIVWDVSVVVTYFVLSLLLWFIPMIPDLAIAKSRISDRPGFLRRAYELLSFGWADHEEQQMILNKAVRILLILIIPMAFAIHTVTSWLFAFTPRTGWDSTNFGAYFVSGAFVSGTSAVVIAMYFFRVNYRLQKYLTVELFDKIAKILGLVAIIYIYFNLNEFLVPWYKTKTQDEIHLTELFRGRHALFFWGVQGLGLVLPVILIFIKIMRRPFPLFLISCFMMAGAWLKRFIIVIPPEAHPNMPIQRVPVEWVLYRPTLNEILITAASFIIVLIIVTILSKFFPVIPISETASEYSSGSGSIDKPKTLYS